MLYQPVAALGLAMVGLTAGHAGVLLWPAVLYHIAAGIVLFLRR